jgi:hypothetical protein
MNKIEDNIIMNKSNINTNINSSMTHFEKNEINSLFEQKQNNQSEKIENIKDNFINENEYNKNSPNNNSNKDSNDKLNIIKNDFTNFEKNETNSLFEQKEKNQTDKIENIKENLINENENNKNIQNDTNNNKNSHHHVFNIIKNEFKQAFIPTISSNEEREYLKKHIIKMNEIKYILNTRNISFRQEYDNFSFNIETEILYKGFKDKTFKEYHLSIFKNFLTLYVKNKEQNNKEKNILINYSQASSDKINKKTLLYKNSDSTENNKIKKNNKYRKNKEDEFIKKQNSLKKIYDIYHPILHLNFNLITCNLTVDKKNLKFYITVLSLENFVFEFKLKNNDINLFDIITTNILINIKNSRGYIKNLFEISLRKDFYTQYFMKVGEFEYYARTGDILLFRGFECSAKIQRFYTKSVYDHVAILFRKDGILNVYEATAKDGCKSRPWKDFIKYLWFLLYDKMVYRKLMINIDDENEKEKIRINTEKKFDTFLKQTDNFNKYSLKFCTILCGSEITEVQKKNEWKKKKGFSCSSLIAAAYLSMDILKHTKNINEILPGNFSYDQQINLKYPFELGPEIIIDFSY